MTTSIGEIRQEQTAKRPCDRNPVTDVGTPAFSLVLVCASSSAELSDENERNPELAPAAVIAKDAMDYRESP
jgi:hypothetical protein